MTRVIGLDLSLTRTGLALVEDGELTSYHFIKSSGKKGASVKETSKRISAIVSDVDEWLGDVDFEALDLAVIEAPSYGSVNGSAHERGGLWWAVADLLAYDVPITTLAPKSRAKYITGNGNADKAEVLKAARKRWSEDIPNHDVADAVGLAFWGHDQLIEEDK